MITFRIPRQREAISTFADDFGRWCDEAQIAPRVATRFQVAFDELLTNAIEHAASREVATPIVVNLRVDAQYLHAEMIDEGSPFDPLAQATPDTTLGLDEREPGGLGLLLVRELIDDVQWHHANGHNHLLLSHRLSGAHATTG